MTSVARCSLFASILVLAGCSDDEPAAQLGDSAVGDSAIIDSSSADSSTLDSTTEETSVDSAPSDAAPDTTADTTITDTADTATTDTADTATDTADTATTDTASDAAPIDPCSPLPSGLTTWTKSDTASVGTPDTYFLDVTPGDPFCATITGGGGGTWSVNVSNGTSSGVYCSGSSKCSIVVPPSQPTLLVTAVTTDIGAYTLTVRYRPR